MEQLHNSLNSLSFGFMSLTIALPIMVVFTAYALIYFLVIDRNKEHLHVDKAGLSRFSLQGIFFVFWLALLNLTMEFSSMYGVDYNIDEFKHTITLPVDILINFLIFCVSIYSGTEGAISGLKTMSLPKGMKAELPPKKRSRLASMFLCWAYLALVANFYNYVIKPENNAFHLTNIYVGLGTCLGIIFLAERAAESTESIHLSENLQSVEKNSLEPEHNEVVPCEGGK